MQLAMHMVTIEDLMPQEHFLRKLDAALDLSFAYDDRQEGPREIHDSLQHL